MNESTDCFSSSPFIFTWAIHFSMRVVKSIPDIHEIIRFHRRTKIWWILRYAGISPVTQTMIICITLLHRYHMGLVLIAFAMEVKLSTLSIYFSVGLICRGAVDFNETYFYIFTNRKFELILCEENQAYLGDLYLWVCEVWCNLIQGTVGSSILVDRCKPWTLIQTNATMTSLHQI